MTVKMRDAHQCAPKTCACSHRLPKPHYHKHTNIFLRNKVGRTLSCRWACDKCTDPYKDNNVWAIECKHCHRFYVWSWHETSNGCWKIRSSMPIFDAQQIVAVA